MSGEGSGSSLGGATSAGATGGASATAVAGGATGRTATGGAGLLRGMTRGVLPVHDHEAPSTGGEIDYLRTAWGEDHLTPGADAHPEYATDVGLAAVQAELEGVYTEAEADARFEQLTRKGAADGYAPLDAGGLVPTAHLPPLAITDTFVAASEGAMLALAQAQVGDLCIRTDLSRTFILAVEPAATLANWLEVAAAGQVTSVNGETGAVSLDAADVGAAAADHTHPSEQSEQWRFQDNPTIADPGDGYLRSNTGVLATATTLAISRTTQDGYDIPPTGFGVVGGDTVYVQDRDDNSKWVRFTADEPLARFATYATGAVTVTGSAGTIAHGQIVQVTFSLAGGGGGGGGGAVDSVNGQTGVVVLDAADVGALDATHTALPNAHHAQAHNHTAGDGSGALTDEVHDGYSEYVNLGADAATPATNRIRLYAKDNGSGVATLYYVSESGQIYELPTLTSGGGGGSGAPANASYVTLAAETKLSGETALGAGVIMTGSLGARPAPATAGRLYLATDTDLVYRDTGGAWTVFATRTADTTITTDASLTSTESPANTYALAVEVSADADNALELRGDGLYATGGAGGAGGITEAEADDRYVNLDGDTMTGSLTVETVVATAVGAVTSSRVYGASSSLTPSSSAFIASTDLGVRFRCTVTGILEAIRWYRRVVGDTPPPTVKLWDTTTGTAVYTMPAGDMGPWASATTAVYHLAPLSSPVTLVAGRDYILAADAATGSLSRRTSMTPTPDTPVVWVANIQATTGTMPTTTSTTYSYLDPQVRTSPPVGPVAQSGLLRLSNGSASGVGWRNAADTADLTLTMDSSDRLALAVGAGALTTTVGAAGGASALPATPTGFLTVVLNGTARKIPYYAT